LIPPDVIEETAVPERATEKINIGASVQKTFFFLFFGRKSKEK
jgi:hypothetical protein